MMNLSLTLLLATSSLLWAISSAQNTFFQWVPGSATFYGDRGGTNNMGGACGYGNINALGFGNNNAAAASVLWKKGKGCGACYEVKCDPTKNRPEYCLGGKSVVVTVTNMCPRGGLGWCNPPRKHLDMSMPSFLQIGIYKAGIINTQMRRVPCKRMGDIKYRVTGNPFFLLVLVYNVAGFGEIQNVEVQVNAPGRTWYKLRQNFGAAYSRSKNFYGQPLNVRITLMNGQSMIAKNAFPKGWRIGATYSGGQFSSGNSAGRKLAKRNLVSTSKVSNPVVVHQRDLHDVRPQVADLRKIQLQLEQKVEEALEVLDEARAASQAIQEQIDIESRH